MTFAKLKIEGVGKFECKNITELDSVVKDIKLKYDGVKKDRLEIKKLGD